MVEDQLPHAIDACEQVGRRHGSGRRSVHQILVDGHPGQLTRDRHVLIRQDELVATRSGEDLPPGLLDRGPRPEYRPAGMDADRSIAVVPDLDHRLDVTAFVGVVERLVGGENVVDHTLDGTDLDGTREDRRVADLDDVRQLLAEEHGLAVVSTVQRGGRVLSSVVNVGVMPHPVSGAGSVAFVSAGAAARLAHIRHGSEVTVTVRRGWRWLGVTGRATLIGPDDPADDVDLRILLREVFRAAGGSHDDWASYDSAMVADRRVAVFVDPSRVLGNG